MNGPRRLHAAVLSAGLLALVPRAGSACDPVWLPISRDPQDAFFVASAGEPARVGVRAELLAVGGPAGSLKPGAVILVPWAYGPDCRPIAWGSAPNWRPPREPAFYTGRLRPRSEWLNGVPTLDVHMAWREPLWRDREPRWTSPNPTEGLLTPAEFFELFAALPTAAVLAESPAAVLARIDGWIAGHATIARREPAVTILGNLRRAASTHPGSGGSDGQE